ncbi:MAG: ABC transporter ATP-binding protein [Eubacterium sp.]|nr:ABC transporter ATP-binding protein [Eubacterium sp.]
MSKRQTSGKSNEMATVAKRMMGYITGTYKVQFIFVVLLIIVSSIGNVAGTFLLRYLIDDYITPLIGKANASMAGVLQIVMMMAAAYAVVVVCTWTYNRLVVNISNGVMKRVRDEMFSHMQKMPIQYFDTNATGDIMSRYTNDTDTLRQMVSQSIPQILNSAITMITVFVSMLILSIPMTVIVIVMLAVMLFLVKAVSSRSSKYFIAQQISLGKVNGYIEEMMNGQKVVKVFNHEEAVKKDFDKVNGELCENAKNANIFANILMPIMAQMGNVSYLVVALVGATLSISGIAPITLGVLASFLQFTRQFTQPVSQVSQQISAVIMALAGARRIFDLLDEDVETDDGSVTIVRVKRNPDGTMEETPEKTNHWAWKVPKDGAETYVELKGDVRFKDVVFGYDEKKTILKHISLFAEPGQKIAFVGATGAGKTTITNLINRFYDIQEGSIVYDGIDVKDIKKDDLRRSLGIVLQDTHLFTGTIRENIRYGRLEATDAQVEDAAKLANADTFIRHLPNGYDTVITADGANLSQGQRQLLAIARAAVADPPVLILDEATSSIDTRTEAIIQSGMDKLMEGRTVFVIAHRLSTVRNSEAIMVLEQGEIIERGSHDELISQKGKYYQLYTGAFELS